MPNSCWNTLRLVGPVEVIKEVLEHNLSFQHFVPCESDCDAQTAAWGTKWEAGDVNVLYSDENQCKLEFRTAWAPPIRFLEAFLARFPTCWVKLTWEIELGWGSGIWIHYRNRHGEPITSVFQWEEAVGYPLKNGRFVWDSDEPIGEPVGEPVGEPEAESDPIECVEAPPVPKKIKKLFLKKNGPQCTNHCKGHSHLS